MSSRGISLALATATLLAASSARAIGESKGGFPNWAERVLHEWTNRARVDPALEMTKCGAPCGEKACYTVLPPLYWSELNNRAARFHSAHMSKAGFFAHDSNCALASSLKTTYPTTCDGSASCACSGAGTTSAGARNAIFGAGYSGEIIASSSDPNTSFYLWLYESSMSTTCAFSLSNGHRWLILKANNAVGYGVDGRSTGDFGPSGETHKIPSGSHYPRSGASVEIWANWYDTAAPKSALVNIDGTCKPMTRTRGTDTNGAWLHTATGLAGCARYYFTFKDSAGTSVTFPTTGSLGIGDVACSEWSSARPTEGAGCGATTIDAGVVDTGTPDTFVPDTFVPDTAKPDTATALDTSVADTAKPDVTAAIDTAIADGTTSPDVAIEPEAAVDEDTAPIEPDAAIVEPPDTAIAPTPARDAAPDPGPGTDASISAAPGDIQGSCGCRAAGGAPRSPIAIALAALITGAARWRRRAARARGS